MPECVFFPGQLLPDFLHSGDSLKASLPAQFSHLDITDGKTSKHKPRSGADGHGSVQYTIYQNDY